jgi:hypothetical protein
MQDSMSGSIRTAQPKILVLGTTASPFRTTIRALTDLSGFCGGTISREDVATFVLDQVGTATWLHQSPMITW